MDIKKIAIQGIEGSFHEIAAQKYFGKNIETIKCNSFENVAKSLINNESDYALMAIENTIAGSLLPNYALIRENYFKVIGEVFIRISMNLMVLPDTPIENIENVYSHPMALKQCTDFLRNYPKIKRIEKDDTSESAKIVYENKLKNTAAIASTEAAEIFGLDIIEKGIETNKQNYTRFLVLSKLPELSEKTNKASICFELGHTPGSLAKVLSILHKKNINLTKIQSVPIIGKPYEYSFYLDLTWETKKNYEKAIHKVLKHVANLSILGEYEDKLIMENA